MTPFDSLDNMKGYLYLTLKIESCYDFMELPQICPRILIFYVNSSRKDLKGRYFRYDRRVAGNSNLNKWRAAMAGINKVILIGNLGSDPEVRYTPDGTAVANFSIATSDEWTDKDTGERKKRTEWHRIVAWRKLGEICGEYLSKGRQVYVEGKLQTRSWEKDGITRYSTEIIASDVQFLGGRDTADTYKSSEPAPSQGYEKPQLTDRHDDDIPF